MPCRCIERSGGRNLFSGGLLGLDNIGVFDRSKQLPIPTGGTLQQADGTAWMGFYCLTMTAMAMELMHDGNRLRVAYGDMASKFFEHFIQICDAMNMLSTSGLWDDEDGFYYDQMQVDGEEPIRMKIRSMVGLLPLIAVTALEKETIDRLPEFKRRFQWFMANHTELAQHISRSESFHPLGHLHWLLAIPSRAKLIRVLGYMLDEEEFLSPYGIRSLSRYHADHPLVFDAGGATNSGRPCASGKRYESFRRQFQPARPHLVSGQLSYHRSLGAIPPPLRRRSER